MQETDPNLSGDHVREGLGAIVSVKVPNPEFEGQTKTRLGNPEVRKIVERVVSEVNSCGMGAAVFEASPPASLKLWPLPSPAMVAAPVVLVRADKATPACSMWERS